jgi:hypothetical protein
MMTLSIRQPWAWAIFNGKDVENRTWATKYRGDLLIHASLTLDVPGYRWMFNRQWLLDERLYDILQDRQNKFTMGAIIGKVTMTGCVIHSSSKWFFGPYGFVFENPVLFKNPIPYRGALKLFDVPDELIKEGK